LALVTKKVRFPSSKRKTDDLTEWKMLTKIFGLRREQVTDGCR